MGARCGLVAIGIWTMLQSLIYGALAVASVLAHRCVLHMEHTQFQHLIYTWYLHDSKCGPINWELLANVPLPDAEWPTINDVTAVARRTDIFAIVYFAINCVWLLASIGLLASVTRCCSPKRSLVYAWVGSTAVVSMFDFAVSGVFLADLIKSLTLDGFLSHFEITPSQASTDFPLPNYLLVVPSALFLAVSARGIVFWIMNVVLVFLAIPMAKRSILMVDNGPYDADTSEESATHYSRNNNNNLKHVSPSRPLSQQRYDDQAPHSAQAPTDSVAAAARQHQILSEHRYFEPLKGRSQSPSPDAELQQRVSPVSYPQTTSTGRVMSLQDALLDQQRQQLPVVTIDRPHLRPASRTGGGKPTTTMATAAAISTATASAPPSDELRGQLPWSYFQSRNDVGGPKRTFTHLRDDEDLPPVPVPDYTLHFPRRDRPSANSSDDGAWAGPEHRY